MNVRGDGFASGRFAEIEPDRRIDFTWGWEMPGNPVGPGSSMVEIDLIPDGARRSSASSTAASPTRHSNSPAGLDALHQSARQPSRRYRSRPRSSDPGMTGRSTLAVLPSLNRCPTSDSEVFAGKRSRRSGSGQADDRDGKCCADLPHPNIPAETINKRSDRQISSRAARPIVITSAARQGDRAWSGRAPGRSRPASPGSSQPRSIRP
jgi:hypothetical protein